MILEIMRAILPMVRALNETRAMAFSIKGIKAMALSFRSIRMGNSSFFFFFFLRPVRIVGNGVQLSSNMFRMLYSMCQGDFSSFLSFIIIIQNGQKSSKDGPASMRPKSGGNPVFTLRYINFSQWYYCISCQIQFIKKYYFFSNISQKN